MLSKQQKPNLYHEPRPFASQTKVSFDTPNTIVYDKKFDTAIRSSQLDQHFERMRTNRARKDDILISSFPEYIYIDNSLKRSSSTHARLMTHLKQHYTQAWTRFKYPKTSSRTQRMIQLAAKNLQIQSQYINKFNELPTCQNINRTLKQSKEKFDPYLLYINWILDYTDWLLSVINQSNAMFHSYYRRLSEADYYTELMKPNTSYYAPLDLRISWSRDLCLVTHQGSTVLLPKTYILLLHNKSCDLLSILVYSIMAAGSNLPKNFADLVLEFCQITWDIITEYGQDGFTIVKAYESLASAETLIQAESWNSEFMNVIVRDLAADTGFYYMSSELRMLWKNCNPPTIHELACLSKIGGHPLVDMENGVQKLHKGTTEEYTLNYDKINECVCYVKQNYIRNYIQRNGRWPPHYIENDIGAPKALLESSFRGEDPEGIAMNRKYGKLPIKAYNFVELLPEREFNELENVIPHLKDKTISALKSQVIAKYVNDQEMQIKWDETRLLLYYLLHDDSDTDHVDFINKYGQGHGIDELMNYLVIRIVPKEKELKVAFRGFGCTTFHNRMLFLAQEKTAMEYLDLFSNEQAMTLSELDLARRLYAFRTIHLAYPRHMVIYIMVDASTWNNHFRFETCDIVMKHTLDPIYNTKVFGQTQQKFKKTFFYVPDGDTTYMWQGQDGGIEGLNQDTWVITYLAQIKTALSGLDVKYHILCKGDDLRLAVMVPMREAAEVPLQQIKNDIVQQLSDAATQLGHKIKVLECYGSEKYFNFSKSASIGTVELPQVLRKIQKCYGSTNAFLPTMDDYVGSTYSNAHSSCKVTTNVIPSFFVALFWSYYYLCSDLPLDSEKGPTSEYRLVPEKKTRYYGLLSEDELVALLLVPSACGGFPIIYLHNMVVRAESDLVPAFLDILDFCRRSHLGNISEIMTRFLWFDCTRKTTWKPLYMDMYALPLKKPLTASTVLRQAVIPLMRKHVRCGEVRELLDFISEDEGTEACIRTMDSADRVYVKIFSVIFSVLPEAILGELVRKFETARSILEFLILKNGQYQTTRLLKKVLASDLKVHQWRLQRCHDIHGEDEQLVTRFYDPCPAKYAYKIRCFVWSKPVEGITMPPISHLIGYTTSLVGQANDHVRRNHFTFTVDRPEEFLPRSRGNYHYGVGKRTPFLGHRTSTGTVNPVLHMTDRDPFLSNIRNLAELTFWVEGSQANEDGVIVTSNLRLLIEKIIKLYTNQPIESFAPFLGSRRSGTVAHHIRTRHFKSSIVPNNLTNIYQLVSGETNTHARFFGDRGHYWINFLHIYCHAISVLTWELNTLPYYTVPNIVWVYTTDCDYCLREVVEPPIVISEAYLPKIRFPRLEITRLGKSAMRVLKESLQVASTRRYNLESLNHPINVEEASMGVIAIIVNKTVIESQRLINRHTQHPSNSAGMQVLKAFDLKTQAREFGMRELTLISNDVLCEITPHLIISLILQHFDSTTIQNLPESIHTIPAYHLPWYGFIDALSTVGRLHLLCQTLSANTNLTCHHLIFKSEQVAAYLAQLALTSLAIQRPPGRLIILSNYEDIDFHRQLERHILIWVLYDLTRDLLFIRGQEDPDEDEIHLIAATAVMKVYLLRKYGIYEEEPEETTASRTYHIRELTRSTDELEDLFRHAELDNISTLLENSQWLVSHLSRVGVRLIYDTIVYRYDEVVDSLERWRETSTVSTLCTTKQICLEVIRSQGVPFNRGGRVREDHQVNALEMDRCVIRPPNAPWIHSFRRISAPSDIHVSSHVAPPIYTPCYTARLASLHRPLGSNNSTINHLLYIWTGLGLNALINLSQISVSILGDGLGNGTLYFASITRNSQIVFTSRPDEAYIHIYPVAALEMIETKDNTLSVDHIREGIWDLREASNFERLSAAYGRQQIIFCDAEPVPFEANFGVIYENATDYYLTVRDVNTIFIMQMSIDYLDSVMKVLVRLSLECDKVYICQPPSIYCWRNIYVVAQHASPVLNYPNITTATARVSRRSALDIVHALARFIQYQERLLQDRSFHLDFNVPNINLVLMNTLPALWVSLYTKLTDTPLDLDYLGLMREYLTTYDLLSITRLLRRLSLRRNINYLLRELSNNVPVHHRTAGFNMDFQAARIITAQRVMEYYGFEIALHYLINGATVIPENVIHADFDNALATLPARDHIPDQYLHERFMRHTLGPNDVRLDYWFFFTRGTRLVQSLVAWMSALLRHDHNRHRDDNEFDI